MYYSRMNVIAHFAVLHAVFMRRIFNNSFDTSIFLFNNIQKQVKIMLDCPDWQFKAVSDWQFKAVSEWQKRQGFERP